MLELFIMVLFLELFILRSLSALMLTRERDMALLVRKITASSSKPHWDRTFIFVG